MESFKGRNSANGKSITAKKYNFNMCKKCKMRIELNYFGDLKVFGLLCIYISSAKDWIHITHLYIYYWQILSLTFSFTHTYNVKKNSKTVFNSWKNHFDDCFNSLAFIVALFSNSSIPEMLRMPMHRLEKNAWCNKYRKRLWKKQK